MENTSDTTLYRLYDADTDLLYVGISGNPGRRFDQHAKGPTGKRWWSEVATGTMEHFATREEAAAAEVAAIQGECPRYNIAHATRPPKAKPAAVAPAMATSGRLSDGAPWWINIEGQFAFITVDRDHEPPAEHDAIAERYAERGIGALRALGYTKDIGYGCEGAVWSLPCLLVDVPDIIDMFDHLSMTVENRAAAASWHAL